VTTQLYLIRHGETVANVELIIDGMRGDAGLTDPLAWVAAEVGSPGSIARASPVVSRTPSRLRWCSAMARFASSIAAVVGSGGRALLPSGVGLVQLLTGTCAALCSGWWIPSRQLAEAMSRSGS
jgi:hypothetical protein